MRRGIPAATLVLLLASCGAEHAEAPAAPAPAAPATATTAAAAPAASSQLGSIAEENGAVTISFVENGEVRELYGDPRTTGKRKYTLGDGPVLYEVKPGDDGGFKLRNPDGSLRWKVKISADKIKISDNEENNNPFELKVKDANRVKVFAPGDRELGNVRYATNKVEVENTGGKVIFTAEAKKPTGAYGVLLLDGIPEHERYILAAEILSRGR
ncbi:MAG TPA: hypothetical protein VFP80_16090 [Thermoanaerobaculia bacterium]|nr:hypothetical protein [Thermoanaerobaculia bacterium]